MNVLMISPGFPAEMPLFTRGLANVGAKVIGVGDQPVAALNETARRALAAYEPIGQLWNEESTVAKVQKLATKYRIDRVECLWEPGMILAAKLREALGIPGMTVEQTLPFRDKEVMKQRLDEAGIRTPHHYRARTENEVREAAEKIGMPLIIKPIAGAGSLDTYRIDEQKQLEEVLPKLRHIEQVSVEEFVEAEEYTFDTVCADGKVFFHGICWYNPRPLIEKTVENISPQTFALRDVDAPHLQGGVEMGHAVLKALDFQTGFTHMEWYRKEDGEVVFGEIACRPPGGRSVDIMNYACDLDLYTGWAEAAVHGRMSAEIKRPYNAGVVFKRAKGQGRIAKIDGLSKLKNEIGQNICHIDILPVGARRRDWRQILISDGYIILRHPDFEETRKLADRVANELTLWAE